MHDLAGAGGLIAMILEMLLHGDGVRIGFHQMRAQVPDLGGVRAETAEHAHTGGGADGHLTMIVEHDRALAGEPVDAGRLNDRGAVAAEVRFEVINGEQEDVGGLLLGT